MHITILTYGSRGDVQPFLALARGLQRAGQGEKGEYNLNMAAATPLFSVKKIAAFCKRWKVAEFALFGSAVRADFSSRSDIDALVTFSPQSDWGLFDHIQMKMELKEIFGRDVDLITRGALEQSRNALLRAEILNSARVLYSNREAVDVPASR